MVSQRRLGSGWERLTEHKADTRPLLSIAIATRNRIPYAMSAIQSILAISDPRLELVVHDNSVTRDLESYTHAAIKDKRFHYGYTAPPFSSIDNFNAVLEMATGEYVCLIGDDDGVNPEILEAAFWAKSNNVDCLAVKNTISYLWEGTAAQSTVFTKVAGGALSVWSFRGSIENADVQKELVKLVRNGGLYYLNFKLPKLYHGLVHRRCLEAVRERTGAYFGGLSPDIFASLAIACVANRVVVTDYPLTIPGACGVSGSVVEGSIKRHSKKLEDAPHFRSRGRYEWCELVPRVYSPETIWVDSGVAALRAMGRSDLVRQLNLPKLAAYCVAANRGVTWPVLRDLFSGMRIMRKNRFLGAIQFAWGLLSGLGAKFARRVWNRVLMVVGIRGVHRIYSLRNMVDVSSALSCYLAENSWTFEDCARRLRPQPVLKSSLSTGRDRPPKAGRPSSDESHQGQTARSD